jgi:hypothetical protein
MIAVRILGYLVVAVTGIVLLMMFRMLYRVLHYLAFEHGIRNLIIPPDARGKRIIWGGILTLLGGCALIYWSYG